VVATKIFFAYVRSNYHVHDRSNNCSCPELNESSTFKKLGKLIVATVLHNSRNCCNCTIRGKTTIIHQLIFTRPLNRSTYYRQLKINLSPQPSY
jgi:hypothetical protein